MRRYFALLIVILVLAAGRQPLAGYHFFIDSAGRTLRWPAPTTTMFVQIPCLGCSPSSMWNDGFKTAMGLWNVTGEFTFTYVDQAFDPCSNPGTSVRRNGVKFDTTLCGDAFSANVLAVTQIYSSAGVPIQAGIIFNGAYKWGVYDDPFNTGRNAGTIDFQRVAVHELGHVLGLQHEDVQPAIMGTAVSTGATITRPTADDIAGVHALYEIYDVTGPLLNVATPQSGQIVTTRTIVVSGTATDSGRGNSGISSVTVNGLRASNDGAAGPGTAGWSISFTPTSNTITVVAYDNSSNRNATTRTITIGYDPSRGTAQGDYDGDGKADMVVFRPSQGGWYILKSGTNFVTDAQFSYGTQGDIPLLGDYDGDGRTDIAVYRPSIGRWFILQSSSSFTTDRQFNYGAPGDIPVSGDYDGDGRADLAVFRPATGTWYILKSSLNFTSDLQVNYGVSGDVPVPGDYDGDGRTDITVFRPATGTWFILRSNTAFTSDFQLNYGVSGDTPVPGDFDGDGRTDIALYRAGVWFALLSSSGFTSDMQRAYGLGGDVPVTRRP